MHSGITPPPQGQSLQQPSNLPDLTAPGAYAAPFATGGMVPGGDGSNNHQYLQSIGIPQGGQQVSSAAAAQIAANNSNNRRSSKKSPKAKVLPVELDVDGPNSNEAYKAALIDPQLTVSPQALGFLPSNYWLNLDSTFGDLVTKFFQRKNNANCRFPHKLYNALSIVEQDPKMYSLLGVKWVTDTVFKVDKLLFGRVLGISSIDGGLFHQQGNFPSHRFCEVTGQELEQLKNTFNMTDIDQDRVRLMHHMDKLFSKTSDEESVNRCKWGNAE